MLIDSHCHLEAYSNPDEIIFRSKSSLEAIISCGHSIESSKKNIDIALRHEGFVYPVVGIGPQSAMGMKSRGWEMEIPDSAVAVGEIGLDYHWAKTSEERQLQKECFLYFLEIASQINLPVVIHSRKSQSDVIKILEEAMPRVVIWHCFSGTLEDAKWAVKQGHYISFIPIHSKTRRDIARLPGIKPLVETDAPYIGKYPEDSRKAVELIADSRNERIEKIEEETRENAKAAFSIS
ncbi:MAG: TatD family hydrolase [Candidatus Micrarchaeia archaeon]